MNSKSNQIEKSVLVHASLDRVWEAITDYRQFGEWFRVRLEVPFQVGQPAFGQLVYPGYEHVRLEVMVVAIEPKSRFAFHWHPYAIEPNVDYSKEPPTLVEFCLDEKDGAVQVTVIESGFDSVPVERRDLAFRMNEGGWAAQMKNIADYLQPEKRPV